MFFLPTHNRPERLKDVLELMPTPTEPGCIFVNGSQNVWGAYRHVIDTYAPKHWDVIFNEENVGVCHAMNICFERYPDAECYGLICDDEYVYTRDWDKHLTAAAGKWNIAHANDQWQSGNRVHAYVTVGGDLVRACGWWSLPGLWHWFHDNVQEVIAKELRNVVFCQEVSAKHRHYINNQADFDDTYKLGQIRAAQDQQIFEAWLKTAPGFMAKIKEKMVS